MTPITPGRRDDGSDYRLDPYPHGAAEVSAQGGDRRADTGLEGVKVGFRGSAVLIIAADTPPPGATATGPPHCSGPTCESPTGRLRP